MKEYFRKPFVSILLTILFSIWVGVIFYNHYPRLWQAIRDPVAAAKIIPPRYMNLGVVGIGLLVLAMLAGHFCLAYLLSLRPDARLKHHRESTVLILAAGLVLVLAWSLYRYPKLLDAGANLALLLMIILTSSFAGRKLLHALGPKSDSSLEEFVFSAGLGLGLFAYAILVLAFLGLLHVWLVWLILVLVGIALFRDIWCSISRSNFARPGSPDPVPKRGFGNPIRAILDPLSTKNLRRRFGGFFTTGFSVKNRAVDILLVSLVSTYLLVNLMGALAPEIEADALVHHLYIPRVYIQNHRLVYIPYHVSSAYPLGIEMLFTLGMLLSSSALAKLLHFSLGVLGLLATYCFGRKYLDSRAALLAATIFYTIPVVAWESTTAYIDLGLTFFTTLEIFALVNWWHARRDKWLAVAAIMCGFAMGTKYLGIFGLVILIAGILLKSSFTGKRDLLAVLRTILIYSFVSALIVAPWLSKNYLFTGNPVYPFLNNVFKSPLMPPVNPTFDRANFGMGDNVLTRYILSPWNMTFHSKNYGGAIGPIFLLFIPFLFAVKTDKVLKYTLLFCALYFALWEISVPVMRYLMPIMPFLSIAVSYIIKGMVSWDNIGNKVLSTGVVGVTATTLFLSVPFFHPLWQKEWIPGIVQHVPYEVVLGIEPREHYLSRYLSSYEVFQYMNRNLPPDARILCFNEEFHYLSDRTLVPAFSFEAMNVVTASSVSELLHHAEGLGVTHFLINWASVEDTQRGLTILQDGFVNTHLDPLYRNEGVALYELSFEALPTENYVWQEGESFPLQLGSGAVDLKATASNGRCLGMGWGGSRGDFVEYEVYVAQNLTSAALFIRYAREGQTGAALNVHLDGRLVGSSPSVSLPPTGGWGYEAEEWTYQKLLLGAIDEGEHEVRFTSQLDGGTVNIDGFFIADSSFHPPGDVHHIRGV